MVFIKEIEKPHHKYDAIVDATDIYGVYGRKAWSSADYIMFEDASLQEVVKKK